MRDSTIFYASFYEAIKDLPDQNQLEVYNAIFELSLRGIEIELTGLSKTIFTLIKPQIKANIARYTNGLKGAVHGKKGGRPLKEKPLENPKTTPDETPNKNNNVNVNVNNNNKEKIQKENLEQTIVAELEQSRVVSEGAFKTWVIIAKQLEVYFTEGEWQAIECYATAKPTLPPHIIKTSIMLLGKWAYEGLDISSSLARSINTKSLIQPFMAIQEDNKGNRLSREKIIEKREGRLIKEHALLEHKVG